MSSPQTIEPSGRTTPCAPGCRHAVCVARAPRSVTLSSEALAALSRITEHRRRNVGSDREAATRREEVRSYAVDVVNAILRASPELADGLGEIA